MKNFLKYLTGFLSAVVILYAGVAFAAPAITQVVNGGTGWGLPGGLTAGTLLTGNGKNPIATTTIGSGLTLSGGVLSAQGTISTSSPLVSGQSVYATGVNTIASVATSTPSIGSVLTYSGTLGNFINGTSGTFGIANSAVTNAMLANSSLTVNGTAISLGGSGTITAASSTLLANNNTFTGTNAYGTPSSLVLTNATGLPNSGLLNSTISGIALGSNLNALTATNGTLTFSGSYNGSVAQTVGLNLANPNSWTALQTFSNATSTLFSSTYASTTQLIVSGQSGCAQFSSGSLTGTGTNCTTGTVTSVAATVPSFLSITGSPITTSGTLAIGYSGTALPIANGGTNATSFGTTNGLLAYNGTSLTNYSGYTLTSSLFSAANATTTQLTSGGSNFYIDSTGHITAKDTIHAWSGTLSPTHAWVMGISTTTTWTATSSTPYTATIPAMPFGGTLRQAVCTTDQSYLNVLFTLGGTALPLIVGVSPTQSTTTFSATTFGEGTVLTMNAGTTTTATTLQVSCTLYATEN